MIPQQGDRHQAWGIESNHMEFVLIVTLPTRPPKAAQVVVLGVLGDFRKDLCSVGEVESDSKSLPANFFGRLSLQ